MPFNWFLNVINYKDESNENEKYTGLLKPEHLYSMLRAYIIEHAPFALSTVVVSDVINAYMGRKSGYPFHVR